jgi:hypothetical protein
LLHGLFNDAVSTAAVRKLLLKLENDHEWREDKELEQVGHDRFLGALPPFF